MSPVLNNDAGLLQEDASVNELSNSDLAQEQHVADDDDDWLQTTEDTPNDSNPEDTGDKVIFGSDADITGDDIGLRDPEESAAAEPDDSETVFDHDADVDPFLETDGARADEDTSLAAPGEPDDETELIEGTQQIDSTGEGAANEELAAEEDGDDYALESEAKEEQALSDAGDADDEEAETFGDWEKGFDPNTNHYFWFNHETGESAWTPPEGWPYEVDTPFEADGEYSVEGEEVEGEYAAEDGEAPVEYDETGEANEHEQTDGDCEGEHSAIESSQHSSEFDDDLFSDQDLPSF
uniref:WW domain-containing protein n=1 Tax=Globisporangium ultimum (strain ATCC 200006 / CBS 805.95 / DAOM BR144) TaxID=431595 RepID=K3WK94_GLOUD